MTNQSQDREIYVPPYEVGVGHEPQGEGLLSRAVSRLGHIMMPAEARLQTHLGVRHDLLAAIQNGDHAAFENVGRSGVLDRTAHEGLLLNYFPELLSHVDFADVAIPKDPSRPIAKKEKFSLLPIVSREMPTDSLSSTGSDFRLPMEYRTTYRSEGGLPYLDTARAIALVYDDGTPNKVGRVIAVAGAGIDKNGDVFIAQIQDVTSEKKEHGKRGGTYYSTGLHNNIAWRETLVNAWAEVGIMLGAENIVIQSDANNRWDGVRLSGRGVYDSVARSMDFTQRTDTNWSHPLADWKK